MLLLGADTALAGFGITPPYVRNDALTQGSEFTQEILLVRGDPIEDLRANVTINVPGIHDWFSVDRGFEFVLPKGQQQVPIQITVTVPEDAPYETYKGNIRIRTSSLDENLSGVSIALGAQVDVDLTISDSIYDFEVKRVEITELEEGFKKWWLDFPGRVTFWMHIENVGNVDAAPTKVEFEVYDKKDKGREVILEKIVNTNEIEKVAPFDTKKVAAHLPTQLKAGSYSVTYRVFKGDYMSRKGELNLNIMPRGLVPGYEEYGFEGLSKEDKLTLIIPAVILALLILILILWLVFRKKINRRGGGTSRGGTPVAAQSGSQVRRAPASEPVRQPVQRPQPVRRTPVTRQPAQRPPAQRPAVGRPSVRRPGRPSGGVIDLSGK